MNLTAAAIRLLAEKGLSAMDIAEIAEAMEPTRTSGAARQARYRERQKRNESDVTRDVTNTPLSRPPNENISNPPTHTPDNKKPARAKGTRLPEGWKPNPLSAEIAATVRTWPDGVEAKELAKFRDWAASASGPNAVKTNWDAAWRNWLRKADDEGRWKRGPVAGQPPPGNSSLIANILREETARCTANPA